ncbi:MAG: sugar phosphate isomerase/epimerase family protein, partial [Phycisphaerae bacterium]
MLDVIRNINIPSLQMCLDPAALVMTGNNPLASSDEWAERVRLFHARDGIAGNREQSGYECRLGDGEVDFGGIFALMREAEFRGPMVARRYQSSQPLHEMAEAREWLSSALHRT